MRRPPAASTPPLLAVPSITTGPTHIANAVRATPPTPSHKPDSQSGTGIAEFTIVAIPIFFLGLAAFETARWFSTNHMLSVALQQAGRAAIVAHGHPDIIQSAFEQSLNALNPGSKRRLPGASGAISWHIEILSPTPGAFLDFGDRRLRARPDVRFDIINNHYLAEQHARYQRNGWADGLGPVSNQTIYEANMLTLRLRFPLPPLVPGVKSILQTLGKQNGSYSEQALFHGFLPLVREVSFVMQSHPINWPLPSSGKIIRPS
ncbi:TadE/TadG family type IV pilus assembly protein [Allopusillimonas ginsengisoli]|uniref:TadE/TadG family type IV pilus assembly protein n=1 Tax=Allopusillimonas ginsengisoli TaxID=453575 RepID=UPI0010215F7A|nr:TadE family protein [Allopusillimonas ginsengisoli]TEA79538.1 pilus assembly protein [Allopusillimonas ginsengisoli]